MCHVVRQPDLNYYIGFYDVYLPSLLAVYAESSLKVTIKSFINTIVTSIISL